MCLSCVDAEKSSVCMLAILDVCGPCWLYAKNQLVMLCVDDELLCLCLLCGFILVNKFSMT